MTTIFVDLHRDEPKTYGQWVSATFLPGEVFDNGEERYAEYRAKFQPWRLLIKSGDNHEALFKSTESYHNKVDAIHAAELAFGANSNVWLRESEHESRALRLVFSVAADEDTLDAINAPDLDLAIDAAEDAAADDEWPVGEVQG